MTTQRGLADRPTLALAGPEEEVAARESRNYGTILSKAGEVWSGSGASVGSAPVT